MLNKYSWCLLWTAATLCDFSVSSTGIPTRCYLTASQILCATFYVRTIERCISQSLPSDLVIKENQICYAVHLDRCIAADFCPEIQVQQ